jgi:hypothetical protein
MSQTPYTFTPDQIMVGGRSVVIVRCSATEALDLELSLTKVVGGGIGLALDSQDATVAAIGGVAQKLSHAELLRLMNMLFKYVTIDGQKIVNIDSAFCDRPRDIWEVFIESVKHNLGPLGEWLREKFQSLKKTPASPESTP